MLLYDANGTSESLPPRLSVIVVSPSSILPLRSFQPRSTILRAMLRLLYELVAWLADNLETILIVCLLALAVMGGLILGNL